MASPKHYSLADFWLGEQIGEGSFARVHVCAFKKNGNLYAIKIMEKAFIRKENKIKLIKTEQRLLAKMGYENIVRMYFSFTDPINVYMVMDLCRGGELTKVIEYHKDANEDNGVLNRALPIQQCKFYLAETLCAVQYLHFNGIIHRDLKPPNILLSANGHIRLTDFGTALDENLPIDDQDAFVGSPEYVSPEVLDEGEVSVGADLWALGVILFQMIVGRTPFVAETEYLILENISSHKETDIIQIPDFTSEFESPQQLINLLLNPDPKKRLGASNNCTRVRKDKFDAEINRPAELRAHRFFSGLEMRTLNKSQAPALPFQKEFKKPELDGADPDWMLKAEAAELMSDVKESEKDGETSSDEFGKFLEPNEKIVMEGLLKKRAGLFDKNRHLLLTNQRRLLYFDPVSMELKGEIKVSTKLKVNLKSAKKFELSTPERVYLFTDLLGNSSGWKDAIEALQIQTLSSMELYD